MNCKLGWPFCIRFHILKYVFNRMFIWMSNSIVYVIHGLINSVLFLDPVYQVYCRLISVYLIHNGQYASCKHLSIYVGSFSTTTTCWCYKWNLLHCWMHSTVGCQQVPKSLMRDNSLSIRKTFSMIQSWKLWAKATTYPYIQKKKTNIN